MLFGFCWWLAFVAVDHGAVGTPLEFESHDGFDASANCSGSAFVGSALDEFVEVGEERLGKSYGDLFGGHSASIPLRDAFRYAPPRSLPGHRPKSACRGRILHRAWSGCVSVFVDESVAAARFHDPKMTPCDEAVKNRGHSRSASAAFPLVSAHDRILAPHTVGLIYQAKGSSRPGDRATSPLERLRQGVAKPTGAAVVPQRGI